MLNFTVPCLFGLEGPVADELRRLSFENVRPENGRVSFSGSFSDIAKANICLRFGERVLIELGSFDAPTFDALFEGVKQLPWETFIDKNGAFPVKGHSLNSKLASIPDCQRIIKKAVVQRLSNAYHMDWFPEEGSVYQIQFAIMKDKATLYLDTSGAGLHKRGYRPTSGVAPLRETLAAAMIHLSHYRGRNAFRDLFCGSGTIPIEAALIAKNQAPGLNRTFAAQQWTTISQDIWADAKEAARAREFSGEYDIVGSDIDPKMTALATENAKRAGVSDIVRFETRDAAHFTAPAPQGLIVTNPPYGERIMEKKEAAELYHMLGSIYADLPDWRLYLLSSHTEFERFFGRASNKKRKLYNGMILCHLFMFAGENGRV